MESQFQFDTDLAASRYLAKLLLRAIVWMLS